MRRLTREQSQALTRSKLLASARSLVARVGYESATIDLIADGAGFSKGAFYSNFSGKEDLFLELLEIHAGQDVEELSALLDDVRSPAQVIELVSTWAGERAADPTWGLLALELFRRARRDATFGDRHALLFRDQWMGVGRLLSRLFAPGAAPADEYTLGGIVLELTYGGASSFVKGPKVSQLVRVVLQSFYDAYGQGVAPAAARRRSSKAAR